MADCPPCHRSQRSLKKARPRLFEKDVVALLGSSGNFGVSVPPSEREWTLKPLDTTLKPLTNSALKMVRPAAEFHSCSTT